MIDIEFSAHFYYHHYQAKQGREGRERIKRKKKYCLRMFVGMINEVGSAGEMLAFDVSAVVRVGNFRMVVVVDEIELAHCWISCDC